MEIQLNEKRFKLRADLAALMEFEQETGLKFNAIGEDSSLWEVGSLIYHFAKRGAAVEGAPFEYSREDFLGLIEFNQVAYLVTAVGAIMGAADEVGEKKAKA